MNRRQFLTTVPAAATTAALATTMASAERKEQPAIPIIDTHLHLWDLGKFRLPWIKEGTPLGRNHLMSDYLREAKGLNVVQAVYMEVDVDPAQQTAEAEYVLEICRKGNTPLTAAVISGRPASEDFRRYITRYKDSRYIKGVRQVLHGGTPPGFCLTREYIRGIQLLGEMGMSFDLCLRASDLADGARLIDACPGTRFILDHCGNANVQEKNRSAWERDMAAVARRKNVVCKVSGIVASAVPEKWKTEDLAPIVRHTAAVFGRERIMFGGDWPVCTRTATFRQWVEALQTIVRDWPQADQRRLFHDNAAAFYGLKDRRS